MNICKREGREEKENKERVREKRERVREKRERNKWGKEKREWEKQKREGVRERRREREISFINNDKINNGNNTGKYDNGIPELR